MKNIFLAFTPYHILLSCSIALDYSQIDENFLFIISDFSESDALSRTLKNWQDPPFKKIIFLPGVYRKNIFRKRFVIRKNIKTLGNSIKDFKIDNFYVFNDARPEAQLILLSVKKNNKNAKDIYVEDGAGAYSSFLLKKKNYFKLLLSKILYGIWYKDIIILGTSQWIDEVMAAFPQFVRPELKTKKIIAIKKDNFVKILKEKVFSEYIASSLDIEKLKQLDTLLIIAHSDLAQQFPRYKEIIKEIFNLVKIHNLKIAIKYHPREPSEDFLSVAERAVILPKSLPIELFYGFLPQVKFIIGDISTPLLTSKWLLGKPEVISMALMLNYSDNYLFNTFKKLNIRLVDNITEIKNIISK